MCGVSVCSVVWGGIRVWCNGVLFCVVWCECGRLHVCNV